jgi:hypothetical protein
MPEGTAEATDGHDQRQFQGIPDGSLWNRARIAKARSRAARIQAEAYYTREARWGILAANSEDSGASVIKKAIERAAR